MLPAKSSANAAATGAAAAADVASLRAVTGRLCDTAHAILPLCLHHKSDTYADDISRSEIAVREALVARGMRGRRGQHKAERLLRRSPRGGPSIPRFPSLAPCLPLSFSSHLLASAAACSAPAQCTSDCLTHFNRIHREYFVLSSLPFPLHASRLQA